MGERVACIGTLYRRPNGAAEVWEGEITAAPYRFEFQLIPIRGPRNANAPSHRIVDLTADDAEAIIGAAWLRTMIRGPQMGAQFFSLTFAAPILSKTLNVAAFPNDEPGTFTITYRSRQKRAAKNPLL